MKVFYSLPRLIEHAAPLLDRIDVVSLDIFDTLFIRRVHDPDMVKLPVAAFVAERANKCGIKISHRKVQALRDRIESEHRARNGQNNPDHEANYDEFMPEMLRQVFADKYSADLFDVVADYEMKMECAVLLPRADLVAWLKKLHEAGKVVILMSDIYLPSKYLKRLLEAKHLSSYVTDVVSSADTFRAKASGTGYPLVQEKHAIDSSRWLHVGDNIISDGIRPVEHGITSLVIHDLKEKQRKGIVRLVNSLAGIRNFWKGRNVLQLMLPLESENKDSPALAVDGYNFFGLMLGYFTQTLAERCKARGITRIYFCSREGWMFFECWKRMAPYMFPDGSAPHASYLHVSRIGLSNAACANAGMTALNAVVALLPVQNRDFVDICRVYGLDIDRLRPALQRAALAPDEEVVIPFETAEASNLDYPFSVLLKDHEFQREVKNQGRAARELVDEYLDSEGFFDHDDIALVDIGWLGTIQNFLNQAISHRAQRPNLHGFLLAATRMVPYPSSDQNRYEGLVFDQNKFNLAGSYILTVKDIMEEICRAPHPSVAGYERVDGRAKPVLRTTNEAAAKAEQEQSEYYKPLQDGIFRAVERYAAATSILGYSASYVSPWLNYAIVSRFAFPTAGEVKRIKHFFHYDEFAGKRKVDKRILRSHQSLWDIKPLKVALMPFIRVRYYYRHIVNMVRIWA